MDDERAKSKKQNLLWLLVLLAVVLVWWWFKPAGLTNAVARDDDGQSAAMPDEILVDFADDVSDQTVAAVDRELGIQLTLVSAQSHDEQFYRAHVPAAREAALLAALSARADVETAEPDAIYSIDDVDHEWSHPATPAPAEPAWQGYPNDPKYKFQWHMDQIHMPEAWKLADGDGVVVAVIDTGVAYENYGRFHQVPDLAGVEFVAPYDFVGNTAHGDDDHGHGTHVAGTIAQATHNGIGVAGIARKVKIMPLKVLSAQGSGSVAAIADAIRYAADKGANVINMSLGGRFPSKVLARAVKYAHDKGVVVVCAAGNDGRGKVGYPAANPGAIAVSATQFDDSVTFYSNWGKEIAIAAPGGNTRVDQNGDGQPDGVLQNTITTGDPTADDYFPYMGTSMASPHVAGVAALVVGEGVRSPDAVAKILKDSARKPAKGYDVKKYGAGILDAKAAVLEARNKSGGAALLLGGLMALAMAWPVRGRRLGVGYGAGVLFGASGLFFLPYLSAGLAGLPVVHALTVGLPSWDLALLGPSGHGNVLFFSALVPLLLVGLLGGVPRARGLVAGLSIGIAAHLVFHAVAGWIDVRWMRADSLWLLANAAVCLVLARTVLKK